MRVKVSFLIVLISFLFIGNAMAVPRGKTIDWAGNGAGKVIFSGDTHGEKQGLKCINCHVRLFSMKRGTAKVTLEEHNNKFCGACHNGSQAFDAKDPKNCTKCHDYTTFASYSKKNNIYKEDSQEATYSYKNFPPELVISNVKLIEPSGDGILEADEEGTIRVFLRNNGKGDALGVTLNLTFETTLKGISFKETTVIGKIRSEEEKTIDIGINAHQDIPTSEATIKVAAIEKGGFDSQPILLTFKTKELIPPKLEVAKVEIKDIDGEKVIRKGKVATVTLTVHNNGAGTAKDVTVIASSKNQYVQIVSNKEVLLKNISPYLSKKADFELMVVPRYESKETGLPVNFELKEKRKQFSKVPDIKLALNERAPEIKIVRIEAKENEKEITRTETEDINSAPDFGIKSKTNDIAVVIGIENYQYIPKADYAYNDAKVVKDYLIALGFREANIELLTDEKATKTKIQTTLESWLPNRTKPDSKVFVYFSGHGSPDPNSGESYILPYDGEPTYLNMSGYALKTLYEKLGNLKAKEVMIVLDACFSGAGGARTVLAKGAKPAIARVENFAIASDKMVVLTSTQGSQISTTFEEKEHGLFTYFLLKALKDGKSDFVEIYNYIKPNVEDEAKKKNVNQSPNIVPEPEKITGKFFLR